MTKRLTHLSIVSALALLGACASNFQATYDHDRNHDFTSYRTFSWISESPMIIATDRVVNPLLEQHIMEAIGSGLRAKGFQFVTKAEDADFVVSFTVGSREKIRVDSYPTMSGGYYGTGRPGHWGWGAGYYGGYYGTETTVRQYTKGMLAVDIFDVSERRPVWHAAAEKTISEKDRDQVQATVQNAVNAVLEGFPPPTS